MHLAPRAFPSRAHLVVDAKKYSRRGYDDDGARPFAVLTSAKMCSVGMSLSPSDCQATAQGNSRHFFMWMAE